MFNIFTALDVTCCYEGPSFDELSEAGTGKGGAARSGVCVANQRPGLYPIRCQGEGASQEHQARRLEGNGVVIIFYPPIGVLGVVMIMSADWLHRINYGTQLSTAGCCDGHSAYPSV